MATAVSVPLEFAEALLVAVVELETGAYPAACKIAVAASDAVVESDELA